MNDAHHTPLPYANATPHTHIFLTVANSNSRFQLVAVRGHGQRSPPIPYFFPFLTTRCNILHIGLLTASIQYIHSTIRTLFVLFFVGPAGWFRITTPTSNRAPLIRLHRHLALITRRMIWIHVYGSCAASAARFYPVPTIINSVMLEVILA